jgi:uncharacterized membrane protein HdeD (DUF308 family)
MNTLSTDFDKSVKTTAKNWGWSALLRGLVTLLFGILVLVYPASSTTVLILFFGWFCLFEGLFLVFSSLTQTRDKSTFWTSMLGGILGILVGVAVLWQPAFAAAYFVFFVAIWALMRGVTEIVLAIEYRKVFHHLWLNIFTGLLTALLGIALMWDWQVGLSVLISVVGIFSVMIGFTLLILAFKLFSTKTPTNAIEA